MSTAYDWQSPVSSPITATLAFAISSARGKAAKKLSKPWAFTKTLFQAWTPPEKLTATPHVITPPNWMVETMTFAGYDVKVSVIDNPDARQTILYPMGFGTQSASFAPITSRIVKNRQAQLAYIELPQNEGREFMPSGAPISDAYFNILKRALFSKQSRLLGQLKQGGQKKLITHSISAQQIERILAYSPQSSNFAHDVYGNDAILHTGIMLDTVGSSRAFNPLKSELYLRYARLPMVRRYPIGTTPMDKAWITSTLQVSDPDQYICEGSVKPTHEQAAHFKETGMALIDDISDPRLRQTNPRFFDLRREGLMGMREPSTSVKTAHLYERIVNGFHVRDVDAEHNPPIECADGLAAVLKFLKLDPEKIQEPTIYLPSYAAAEASP